MSKKKIKYKIDYVDRVLDSVHGYIELTKIERKIIELPIFKRLQSIKQLSLVNWVFPGAEHTRYTHSLGVMQLADKMVAQLPDITDEDRQLVRLAGLLHDIGHYPLSHVGEHSYMKKLVEKPDFIENHKGETKKRIEGILKTPTPKDKEDEKEYHHEEMGARIIMASKEIDDLIKLYCPFISKERICDIIVGKYERYPEISKFVQLLHSELDADRIDYLMRDGSFSGTSYGGVDIGVIIKNLSIKEKYGVEIVGIKPKGISAADQYLMNRFLSKSQVIFNRHVVALEFMAEAIIRYAADNGKEGFPKVDKLIEYATKYEGDSNKTFLKFTDHLFWNLVYALANDKDAIAYQGNEYITDFAKMLVLHREIKTNNDSGYGITCSGFDYEEIKSKIESSAIYENLHTSGDTTGHTAVQMFHSMVVTGDVPEKEYLGKLELLFANIDNYEQKLLKMDAHRRFRLQNGLAVIDNDEIRLLTDDDRSLMKSMYKLKLAIFREYHINKIDDV